MSLRRNAPAHPRRALRRTAIHWFKRGLMIAVALAIVLFTVRAWMPKPVRVETTTASRKPLTVEVVEQGQTRVRDRFVVSAPLAGILDRIALTAGETVEAGAPVARIEAPRPALLDERSRREASARLAAAVAHARRASEGIQRAKVALQAATRDANRTRILSERGALARVDQEKAETAEELSRREIAAAEADRSAAAAEVAAARAVLQTAAGPDTTGRITVTSPIHGEVLRVLRESGGPVAAGTPLLELGDVSVMEVAIDVLSRDAARMRPGMPCVITGWGGERDLTGEVSRIEPSAFTRISALGVEEQRVKVIVSLAAPPPSLGDAFRVDAHIITWRSDRVLTVPASAVFRDHERWAVYTIVEGRARLTPIELGHRGRTDVEIISGIAEGTPVILHPGDQVRDAGKVVAAQ